MSSVVHTEREAGSAYSAEYRELQKLPAGLSALPERELAVAVCGSCHLFPEPGLLPREAWRKGVLPRMALRLEMDPENLQPLRELRYEEINRVMQAGIFPAKPIVDSVAWAKITGY